MAEVIRMPRLSDTMEEGNIIGWLKKVGDSVASGDILAEVETDKATMELESFHDGYLLYISVEEGPVPVNDVLAVIGNKGEDYKAILATEKESETASEPTSVTASSPVATQNGGPSVEQTPQPTVTTEAQRIKSSP